MAQDVGYEPGQSDTRPWGDWTVLDCGPGYVVKRIRVSPGSRLSLQRHQHRAEQWTVVSGVAHVTIGHARSELRPGESIAVPLGAVHRAENAGPQEMVFIEVQHGALLLESDIERLQDDYDRT